MASLADNTKWQGLIKTTDTESLDGSKREITDGQGNASGIALSQTRVWLKQPNIENVTEDTAENTALVLNSNGDVRTRDMNANVFNSSLQNRFIGKTTGAQDSPLPFSSVGTDTADSISVGENLALNETSTGIEVTGASSTVNARVEARIKFVETDAKGTISLVRNSTTLVSRSVINNFATASAEDVAVLSFPFVTETSADDISVEFASTSGTIRILENSLLDIEVL